MFNSAYSKVQHLADALFFRHDPRKRYFAMLTSYTGYFDTSGSRSGGTILVSGGLVASVDQWSNFDEHWKAILDRAGIQDFHMTDFLHGENQFKDPKWKKSDGYADNFLKKLVNAICKQANRSTPIYAPTMQIRLDEWQQLNTEYPLLEFGLTPLALAAGACIGMAYMWCMDHGISPDHLECFHEDGDLDKGSLMKMIKKWFDIEMNFKTKKLRPLQACDLLVWEASYPAKQKSKNAEWNADIRPSMRELLNRIDCDHKKYTLDGWRKVCAAHDIPKRATSASLSPAVCNHPASHV